MRYRSLGRTGLRVSEICLGCMTFGPNQWGAGNLTERESADLVSRALDAGVNFFDTADIYAFGAAETHLGKALRGRRDRAVVATKVRGRMSGDPNDLGLSRRHIIASCEASLRRLETDRIDLYQIHCADPRTPLEETLEALDHLVRTGKVLYVGCSNLAAWQLAKSLGIQDRRGLARFVSLQPFYALSCRDVEHELVPLCLEEGLGILPWSPLHGGVLSGKYRRGGAGRSAKEIFPPADRAHLDRCLDALEAVAAARGVSCAEVALAWLLGRPGVSSVIIGARTAAQLDENLKASGLDLSAEEMRRLDEASATPVPYPQWMFGVFEREDS